MLAVSLDGRLASAEGGAARFGGSGDRRVLEEALAWSDACLLGAETLRLHRTTCLIRHADLLQRRRGAGLSPQPVAIVASRSFALSAELPFFRQPIDRWLLRVDAPIPTSPCLPIPSGFSRVEFHPDWCQGLNHLAALGVERLAVLGGARLAAALLQEGVVDELQLTICPLLLGGGHSWLPQAVAMGDDRQRGWTLAEHRCLGRDELLLRYVGGAARVVGDPLGQG